MVPRYKVDDERPELVVQLQAEAGFDLTGGKTVTFDFEKPDGTLVTRNCDIVNSSTNVVRVVWQPGDMDQAGSYRGEFVVDDAGATRTFPPGGYQYFQVLERLIN